MLANRLSTTGITTLAHGSIDEQAGCALHEESIFSKTSATRWKPPQPVRVSNENSKVLQHEKSLGMRAGVSLQDSSLFRPTQIQVVSPPAQKLRRPFK